MQHCHTHKSGRNLTVAILLNLVFFVVELICGNWFNSKIILADALHDLGDVLLLSTSLIMDKVSRKKPTFKYSYGFRRLVVFGAILNSIVLLFGSWQIAKWLYFEVVFSHKHPYVNIPGLLAVSVLGIMFNLIAALRVYGSKNILDKTVFTHLLEDLLGWVLSFLTAVLIGFTGLHQLDQIVSVLILMIVVWNALENIWRIVGVLFQAAPDEKDLKTIKIEIMKIPEVKKIDSIHFWSLDGELNVFTARLFIDRSSDLSKIRRVVSRILMEYSIVDSTLELIEK